MVYKRNTDGVYEEIINEYHIDGGWTSDGVTHYYTENNVEISEDEYYEKVSEWKNLNSYNRDGSIKGNMISAIRNY